MKTYHMADKISPEGAVSPLCAKVPRAIDLKRASWTIRAEAVTCPKCLAAIASRAPTTPPDPATGPDEDEA